MSKLPAVVETERFILRELQVSDVSDRYLSWFRDTSAARFIESAARTTTLETLREYVRERSGRDDVLFLGIFERESGSHIGNVKYEPIDSREAYAVMGIFIGDPAFRGRGVAPEILVASARLLAETRGIRQIVLGVHTDNVAAIKSYERIGFVTQATPHIPHPAPGTATMVWNLAP